MKRIFTAITVVTLAFAGFGVSPALAHTEVVSTSPGEATSVNAGVLPIEITFGEDLLQTEDNAGSDIMIQDANGENVPVLCATVDGARLHAEADIAVAGTATVSWRTVADDGHPVSGTFTFEVANEDGYVAGDSVTDCPSHLGLTPMPTALDNGVGAGEETAQSGDVSICLGFGIAVLIVFVFAVIGAVRTKRQEDKRAHENN